MTCHFTSRHASRCSGASTPFQKMPELVLQRGEQTHSIVQGNRKGLESFLPFQYHYLHSMTALIFIHVIRNNSRAMCETLSVSGFPGDTLSTATHRVSAQFLSYPTTQALWLHSQIITQVTRVYLSMAEASIVV